MSLRHRYIIISISLVNIKNTLLSWPPYGHVNAKRFFIHKITAHVPSFSTSPTMSCIYIHIHVFCKAIPCHTMTKLVQVLASEASI